MKCCLAGDLVYFTDTSKLFQRRDVVLEMIQAGGNGALLKYNLR